jgi:hypothetical protein
VTDYCIRFPSLISHSLMSIRISSFYSVACTNLPFPSSMLQCVAISIDLDVNEIKLGVPGFIYVSHSLFSLVDI